MRRHRPLLLAWLANLALVGYGMVASSWTIVLALFAAMVLAVMTANRSELVGDLRYRWPYRGALGILLAATGTVVVAAGSTVVFGSERAVGGLIVLASTNLVAAVMAWRALVKPTPRRAALAGLIVVIAELFAMIADLVINLDGGAMGTDATATQIALIGCFAAIWAGAVVCMAALACFEPASLVTVPGARVVDGD